MILEAIGGKSTGLSGLGTLSGTETTRTTGTVAMVRETVGELEQKLAADGWLTSGQIAKLLDRSRSTIHARLTRDFDAGVAERRSTLGGRNYEWKPEYVRALIAEAAAIQRKD